MFESSVHYKLRKRKKQWIVVGISVVSGVAFTVSLSMTQSFAAENDSTTTPANALVEKSETPVTSDVVKSDQSATTNQVTATPEKVVTTELAPATTAEVPTDTNTKSSVTESTPVTDSAPKASEATPVAAATSPKAMTSTPQVEVQTDQNKTAGVTSEVHTEQVQPVTNTQPSANISEVNAVKDAISQPSVTDQTVTNQVAISEVAPIQTNVNGTNNGVEAVPAPTSNAEQVPSTKTVQPSVMNSATSAPAADTTVTTPVVNNQASAVAAYSTTATPATNQTPVVATQAAVPATTAEDATATQTYTISYRQVSESGKVLNEAVMSGMGIASVPNESSSPGTDYNHFYDPNQVENVNAFLDNLSNPIAGYTLSGLKGIQDGKNTGEFRDLDQLPGIVKSIQSSAEGYRMSNNHVPIFLSNFGYDILYKPITYQVTFDSNGGDKVGPTSYTIENGIDQLVVPTRAGYNFGGWQEGNDVITGIKTGTMGDKALKAIWNLATYQVKFNADGGSPVADQSYTINDGITSFSPSTRAGYIFVGWTNQSGVAVNSIPTGQSGDMNLKAKWTPLVYQVTFDSAGGSTVTPVSFTPDKEVKQLPMPTKANYSFEGWYGKDGKKVSAIPTGTISDVALVAQWAKATANPTKPADNSSKPSDKNNNSSKQNDKNDNSSKSSDKNTNQNQKTTNPSTSNQKNTATSTSNSIKNGLTTAGTDKKVDLIQSSSSGQTSQDVSSSSTDNGTTAKMAMDKLAGVVESGATKLNLEKTGATESTMSAVQGDQNLSEMAKQNTMTQPIGSMAGSSNGSMSAKTMSTPASNANMATNQSTMGNSSSDSQMAQRNSAANQAMYPKTGEKENHLGILGMVLTAIAGLLGIATTRKKSETEK